MKVTSDTQSKTEFSNKSQTNVTSDLKRELGTLEHELSEGRKVELRDVEAHEKIEFDKDMDLPAEALAEMVKLMLKNVKIIILEWIPSGPNFISIISEEMGGLQGREWMFITQKEDVTPFSGSIDESVIEKEFSAMKKTNFLAHQTTGKETQARSQLGGKAQIRVVQCHLTDYLEFEARIFYEETKMQKENVDIYIDRNGLFAYSASLQKAKMGKLVSEKWIPVFMLTRVIPDLIEDTTPLSDGLLGKYQKDMLNAIFEGFKARNKYVLIVADEINPVKVPAKRKELCCKNVHELLKEDSARKAILELVESIPNEGIMEIGGSGSGRFIISGTRASLLIDPEFSSYSSVLKLPLLCKALGSFLKTSYQKIWVLWKELTKIGHDTLDEIKEAGRIDITKATKTQEIIAERSSRVTLINDVINYALMSCDIIDKQFDLLKKGMEHLPEQDIRRKLVDQLTFETSIEVLKSRAVVQNNLTKNLLDDANGTAGVINTMVNNELIRQSKRANNTALTIAVVSLIISLFSMSIPTDLLVSILPVLLAVVATLIAIVIAGRKAMSALQARRKTSFGPTEKEFRTSV